MLDDMMAVYERKKGHKLIFQPRLRHWYDVNYNVGTLPKRYKGQYLGEVYKDLGITPREVWGTRRLGSEHGGYFSLDIDDDDNIEIWTRRMRGYKGKSEDIHIISEFKTPKGSLRQIQRMTEHGTSLMFVEYPLKDLEDLDIFEYILEERTYEWDQNRYIWGYKRFGKEIPLRANLERIPIMWLIISLMGFQRTVTMLWKHPDEIESFMKVLEKEHLKQIEAYKGNPIIELNFVDNMHQDLCPPHYFRDYVIPFFKRVIPKIHAQGMYVTSHWDGFIKQLLPLVGETGLDGLECVTPLPQGDITIEEMKLAMGDMFLRDGIPAVYLCPWTKTEDLKNHVESLIESFYPRLILGASDMLPANGDVERIKLVNNIVENFNKNL